MKLVKYNLIETLRKLNDGKTAYQARKIAGITVRRVYQIKCYNCNPNGTTIVTTNFIYNSIPAIVI